MTVLELVEALLSSDDGTTAEITGVPLTADDVLAAVRFARYGPSHYEAPPWWAEVISELRAQRREDREALA